jgi:hypothetical protein
VCLPLSGYLDLLDFGVDRCFVTDCHHNSRLTMRRGMRTRVRLSYQSVVSIGGR